MLKKKILIGSPICQNPNILNEFFISLKNLHHEGFTADFIFIDDNTLEESKNIVKNFIIDGSKVFLFENTKPTEYICTEKTHKWNDYLIWKVGALKDIIIRNSISMNYDYLFLVDSDLIMHPNTLMNLIESKKDIISEIFWTKWHVDTMPLPQVWLYDTYAMHDIRQNDTLSDNEVNQKIYEFLNMLKIPGIYRVGGLGACTLISRYALNSGLCFKEIYNLSFTGEDRHFCIRAAALGFELFVDTAYPAFHIYRESQLKDVPTIKEAWGYAEE